MTSFDQSLGVTFCRIIRRRPFVFALTMLLALSIAGCLWYLYEGNWLARGFVGFMIFFYGGLLAIFAVKVFRGTWAATCIRFEEVFTLAAIHPLACICPQCGKRLEERTPITPNGNQRWWGGFTCSECGADVDRYGRLRPPAE